MGGMLTQNERMQSSLRDADAAEAGRERQLRHNLQEDARQALGTCLICWTPYIKVSHKVKQKYNLLSASKASNKRKLEDTVKFRCFVPFKTYKSQEYRVWFPQERPRYLSP